MSWCSFVIMLGGVIGMQAKCGGYLGHTFRIPGEKGEADEIKIVVSYGRMGFEVGRNGICANGRGGLTTSFNPNCRRAAMPPTQPPSSGGELSLGRQSYGSHVCTNVLATAADALNGADTARHPVACLSLRRNAN